MKTKVDLYPSALKRNKFLAVPAGTNLKTWPAPTGFDPDLIQVQPLENTIEISPGEVGRIALNPDDVIDQLNQKGWALVEVNVTVTIKTHP